MLRAAAIAVAVLSSLLSACAGNQPGTTANRQITRGEALLAIAVIDFRRKNFGNTIAAATAALQSGTLNPRQTSIAYEARGLAHLELRNAKQARDDFNAGVNADAANPSIYLARAHLNMVERHIPQARNDLDRSIELKPNHVAHYLRGMLRLAGRDRNGAREDFERTVALQPTAHEGYYGRGLVHHMAGQYAQARKDYEKALELQPGFSIARIALDALSARRPAPNVPQQPDRVIQL